MAYFEVYRGGKVHVMAEKCSTCIYRKGGVEVRDLKGFTKSAQNHPGEVPGGHIPCHQTYEPLGVPGALPAICRGYWDLPDRPALLVAAEVVGAVEYDPVPVKHHPDGLSSGDPLGPII